jgi:hypothetical protein
MSNDERVFLSEGLKDLIDLDSLRDTYNNTKTESIKYLDSEFYLQIHFVNQIEPLQLEVFHFKKNKDYQFKIIEVSTENVITFLNNKINHIVMKIKENQYVENFHNDNYEILYSMQYKMKDNYKLTIKIKKREDVL